MEKAFEALIQEYADKLRTISAASVTVKQINYGCQIRVECGSEKVTVSVYNGKKGIKLVWSGKESLLRTETERVLIASNCVGLPGILLKDMPDFDGLWVGSDESGKGDFFGPLVVAAVMLNRQQCEELRKAGVKDCKELTDKKIGELVPVINSCAPNNVVLVLKPAAYNLRYAQMLHEQHNLNTLLAKGHIAALSKCLSKNNKCHFALVDRFSLHNEIESELQAAFPGIIVVQRTKAENDIAVAAASILARARFLAVLRELSEFAGCKLPKGGGEAATICAREIVAKHGREFLRTLVKMHFANYQRI